MSNIFDLTAKNFEALVNTQSHINETMLKLGAALGEQATGQPEQLKEWSESLAKIGVKQEEVFELIRKASEVLAKSQGRAIESSLDAAAENQKKILESVEQNFSNAHSEWMKAALSLFPGQK